MLIGKYGKRSHFMAVPIHFKWITWHYFLWLQQSYRNLPVATSGWKTDTSVLMCKQSLFRVALNCVRNPTSCFITFLWSPLTVDLVLTKWGCSDRNNNLFGYLKSFTMLVKKMSVCPVNAKYTPKWFSIQITLSPVLVCFHDLLSLHDKDCSSPWLTRAILPWSTAGWSDVFAVWIFRSYLLQSSLKVYASMRP